MVSKLSTFLIVAVVVIGLDAKCSEKPTEITSTTITTASLDSLYHICPRSMHNWILQHFNVAQRCNLGQSGNNCRGSSCGEGLVCCQDLNGCNQCVNPCPTTITPPNNCRTGFTAYNGPTDCVRYVCVEDLGHIQTVDKALEQAALEIAITDGLIPAGSFIP